MFGYVRPVRDELKCRDFDLYRAAYCGLCPVHEGAVRLDVHLVSQLRLYLSGPAAHPGGGALRSLPEALLGPSCIKKDHVSCQPGSGAGGR